MMRHREVTSRPRSRGGCSFLPGPKHDPPDAASGQPEAVTICICTYKRPQLLTGLLDALARQRTDQLLTLSIVVVDNDLLQSARDVVMRFKRTNSVAISYYCEPERNISLARNRAVLESKGDF